MRKPEFRPNPEPAWVKETLIEDFADSVRDHGGLPNSRVIDECVTEDLRRHEARKREGAGKRRGPRRKDPAADMAREAGSTLKRGEYDEAAGMAREKRRQIDLAKDQTRWHLALRARMMELLKRGGAGAVDFLYPAYAREYINELVNAKVGSGRYYRKPVRERQLMLSRAVENIADRSNAIPGLGDWRRGT